MAILSIYVLGSSQPALILLSVVFTSDVLVLKVGAQGGWTCKQVSHYLYSMAWMVGVHCVDDRTAEVCSGQARVSMIPTV